MSRLMEACDAKLIDLRDHHCSKLLDDFICLYDRTFTDPTEREDPGQWHGRLWGDEPPSEPRTHLLVAGPGRDQTVTDVWGGLVFEYYSLSCCGLLTYLVIERAHRGQGLAGRLVAKALTILGDEARKEGHSLRAVFAETEDPAKVGENYGEMAPRDRLRTLARLGARWIDIPYVQPQLVGGSDRSRCLLLLGFDVTGHPTQHIEGAIVRDFLHEFYHVLGVTCPERDQEFQGMIKPLGSPVPLKELDREMP